MDKPRILVYTVSRADTPEQVARAVASLNRGKEWAGIEHEWILWSNAPGINATSMEGFVRWGDGENVGQHVPLGKIIDYARCDDKKSCERLMMIGHGDYCTPRFDFIVRVDDDVEWMSKNWLKRLVEIELRLHEASKNVIDGGVWPVLGPRVKGLNHQIPIAEKVKIDGIPIFVVPILGGLCRLHHVSFFEGYKADCRRAMGSGDATSVTDHSVDIKVPLLQAYWVRVAHKTAKMESEDPGYFKNHGLYQSIPYIPVWRANA